MMKDKYSKELLLRGLIQMAHSDNELDARELKVIERVAAASGFSKKELQQLLIEKPAPGPLKNLAYEDKFEYLYQLMVLMKADEVVVDEEINFVQRIATKLGFQRAAVMELYAHTHTNLRNPEILRKLKDQLRKLTLKEGEHKPESD